MNLKTAGWLVAALVTTTALGQKQATKRARAPEPTATPVPARGGWRTAKWGMSPAQVLAAFPSEAVSILGGDGVEIPAVDVLGRKMKAAFKFTDGALSTVALGEVVKATGDERGDSRPSIVDFQAVEAELTKKYGGPASTKHEPLKTLSLGDLATLSETAKTTWITGDTAIELTFSHLSWRSSGKPAEVTRLLGISYSDRGSASGNL